MKVFLKILKFLSPVSLASILSILLLSCSEEKENRDYFIIEPFSKLHMDIHGYVSEVYPVFYGRHNFILIDSSTIYYHEYIHIPGCGTGLDYNKPPRIFLHPDSLLEIKFKDLEKFIAEKKEINDDYNDQTIISISSPIDTIRNKGLWVIKDYFNSKKDAIVGFQRCTEEQERAAQAKLTNSRYSPFSREWKIGFDQDLITELPPPMPEKNDE